MGDIIYTRFPPEPNGFLHLGHLKAMMYDFDKHDNCRCFLRLDDTNPEAEKDEYVNGIIEDVQWLGFTPWKITRTSDYFDQLYNFAIDLIKHNKAYVDKTNPKLISEMRHNGLESIYRNRSIEDNLQDFINMKNGYYNENEAVLRLKIDMQNDNHTLRDPIAYRIKFNNHHSTKNKWCIYPTYDYSHGIVDALENITYSYCTMEFFIRREQYYWPVNELIKIGHNLVPAEVTEFGRFNVKNNHLSKRKFIQLINEGYIDGFDDPRLLTIRGLRRRGFTPEILKQIIRETTTMARNETEITEQLINHYLRTYYDNSAIRVFGIINPLKAHIVNPIDIICRHPNHPKLDLGSHIISLNDKLYIEETDYKEDDDPLYYRFSKNKIVRLKYIDFYRCINKKEDIIEIEQCKPENPKKIKGIIQWISEEDAIDCIYEHYNSLMNGEKINIESKIIKHGKIEKYVMENLDKPLQLERVGYYKFDRYENNKPVFIKIIELNDKYNVNTINN